MIVFPCDVNRCSLRPRARGRPRLAFLFNFLCIAQSVQNSSTFCCRPTCACVMMSRKPIFCVVIRHGEVWQVEAEWPDGTIEPIDKFKAHYEALHWVRTHSAAWIEERIPTSQVAAYQ